MIIETIAGTVTVREVVSHVVKWLANLKRARQERQQQSLRAVNKVISLARKSRAYSRSLKAGKQDYNVEADLAASWSDLSLELTQLKLAALAKKCDLISRHWADPEQLSPSFLAEADISFETVERLARDLTVQINVGRHKN